MEQTLELSSLHECLCEVLMLTEEVKAVLKSDCDEALISLKPWCVDSITKKEASETICTCCKTRSENEIEDISTRISKTLIQTQELREKISLNTIKEKKCLKQPSISDIYSSSSSIPANNQFTKKVPCSVKDVKRKNTEKSGVKYSNTMQKPRSLTSTTENITTKLETRKRNSDQKSKIVAVGENSTVNNRELKDAHKHLIKAPPKSTKEKNFLAINKLSVKNYKQAEKHKTNTLVEAKIATKLDKRQSAASINELKSLIDKVSVESNSPILLNAERANCPLHGDVTSQYTSYEHSVVTMDVIEGLDRFSIPGEVIKPLKIYHNYVKTISGNQSVNNVKQQKSVNKFLTVFSEMNKHVQSVHSEKNSHFTNLSRNVSFFENVFSKNMDIAYVNDIKEVNAVLNSIGKNYRTKVFDAKQTKRSNTHTKLLSVRSNVKGWMSNGIWNRFCIENLGGISRCCSMRYTNRDQLLLFFEMIHQLQQTLYFRNLFDIILQDVIPDIKQFFDPTDIEFIRAYKMIAIVSQGLNSNIPVLVKTDE